METEEMLKEKDQYETTIANLKLRITTLESESKDAACLAELRKTRIGELESTLGGKETEIQKIREFISLGKPL